MTQFCIILTVSQFTSKKGKGARNRQPGPFIFAHDTRGAELQEGNMRNHFWSFVLWLSIFVSQGASADSFSGKIMWGLATRTIAADTIPELAGEPGLDKVWEIKFIPPGSTGEKEGLQPGDLLLKIDGQAVDRYGITNASGRRGGGLAAGDMLPVLVLKRRNGTATVEEMQLEVQRYFGTEKTEFLPPAGAQEFANVESEHLRAALPLIQKNNRQCELDDLLQRLRDVDLYRDPCRLPIYSYLMRNPFHLEAVSRSIVERFRSAGVRPMQLLECSEYLLNFAEPEMQTEFRPEWKGGDLAAHLDYIEMVLGEAARYNQAAFARISEEERRFVLENRDAMLESFVRYKTLTNEPDVEITRNTLEVCRILSRIDMKVLFMQARIAALLIEDSFLASLYEAAAASRENAIVAERDTPYGKILIAGTGDNVYSHDYAVLYELGGNDLYLSNQGGSVPGAIPTAVLVDYAGCDAYETTDSIAQGGGNLGVGILRDLSGDDRYIGISGVQGCGFGGIGILLDDAGNDSYRGISIAQGISFFGAGILADISGNDRYESHRNSQGVGFVRGIGILTDHGGDDFYYCKGGQQTTYNTRGHYEGWGQGIGMGMRPYVSGGVGVLYDRSGRDHLEGGTYVQGGGYFYSYGICCNDGNETDNYIGTRYSQGFGTHQAAGAFLEMGGNDVYRTRCSTAQGVAWDEAVSLFIDEQGDDSYNGGIDFSFGAVAQNALVFFWDRSGSDTYETLKPARSGGNGYHGGSSLGIFIDDGGAVDSYVERENNTIQCEPDVIFIDR